MRENLPLHCRKGAGRPSSTFLSPLPVYRFWHPLCQRVAAVHRSTWALREDWGVCMGLFPGLQSCSRSCTRFLGEILLRCLVPHRQVSFSLITFMYRHLSCSVSPSPSSSAPQDPNCGATQSFGEKLTRSLKPPAPAMGRGGHAGDNKGKGQPGKKGRGRGQMSKRTESEQQRVSACSIGRSKARAQAHRQAGQVPEPIAAETSDAPKIPPPTPPSPSMAKSGHSPLHIRLSSSPVGRPPCLHGWLSSTGKERNQLQGCPNSLDSSGRRKVEILTASKAIFSYRWLCYVWMHPGLALHRLREVISQVVKEPAKAFSQLASECQQRSLTWQKRL